MNELGKNTAELNGVTCIHHAQDRLARQGMLFQLVANDSEREWRAVNGDVDASQKIGDRANVILMPVRQKNTANAVLVRFQVGDVLNDEVDARHIVFGKAETTIDHDQIVVVFNNRHVFAYLANSAQGDYANFARHSSFFLFSWHCKFQNSFLLECAPKGAFIKNQIVKKHRFCATVCKKAQQNEALRPTWNTHIHADQGFF